MKSIFGKTLLLCLLPALALGQSKSTFDPLLKAAKKTHSDALVVIQDGKTLIDYHNNSLAQELNTMSVTKPVVGLAIADLLDQGKIDSVDTPVAHFYPEWRQGQKKNITLRHLMNHTSGLQNVANAAAEIHPSPDILQLALCASVVNTPGTKVEYNNKAVNILPGIVKEASGQSIKEYLKDGLFKEMDITDFDWKTDKAGNYFGMSGLRMRANDVAKIGQLMLQDGSWQGRQLLPKDLVEQFLNGSPEHNREGLLWQHVVKTRYVIDNDQLEKLQQADVPRDWIDFFRELKGTYTNRGNIVNKIMGHFSRDEFFKLRKIMHQKKIAPWRVESSGKILGYKHSGDFGQYLYIYPQQKLVAVRMVSPEGDYSRKTDMFSNFGGMVYKLATSQK